MRGNMARSPAATSRSSEKLYNAQRYGDGRGPCRRAASTKLKRKLRRSLNLVRYKGTRFLC